MQRANHPHIQFLNRYFPDQKPKCKSPKLPKRSIGRLPGPSRAPLPHKQKHKSGTRTTQNRVDAQGVFLHYCTLIRKFPSLRGIVIERYIVLKESCYLIMKKQPHAMQHFKRQPKCESTFSPSKHQLLFSLPEYA